MTETIFGDRLHQARTLRQRKLADLAELVGCSVPTLSKWEHARTVDLSPDQFSSITENLRFSPAFFTARPASPLTDHDLLFKAPKDMLKREIAWLREFVRLISELLDLLDDRRHLPPVKIRLNSSNSDIPTAAQELRESLGLPASTPIDFLTHPVERAGVVVVVRRRTLSDGSTWASLADEPEPDINERHEGCSTWVGEFSERPLIVMRGATGWEKTRWILAHELGHLSLHAGRMPVSDEAEEEASSFASELLAPIQAIANELPRAVTLAGLLDLKLKWGISLSALIRHLHRNGIIADQRKKTLYDQLYTRRNPQTGRSYGATEPGWDRREPERPQLISSWLKHITGSLVPTAISMTFEIFPPDLLASILNEQRPTVASGTKENPIRCESSGEVVRLRERNTASQSPEINALRPYLIASQNCEPELCR